MQFLDGFFHAGIELEALARCGTMHSWQETRELLDFLVRQGNCEIRCVLRDDFAENPNGIEFGWRSPLAARCSLMVRKNRSLITSGSSSTPW
ncbi:MAG: hypothetical protein IPK39_24065 [Sulfuritalea sp.]|nr:hypothetical protein [Sulfuritalea sp.]